jgi:hypothetical protein
VQDLDVEVDRAKLAERAHDGFVEQGVAAQRALDADTGTSDCCGAFCGGLGVGVGC